MGTKKKVQHPCKCNKNDHTKQTAEDQGEGWNRYTCFSCGRTTYNWNGTRTK